PLDEQSRGQSHFTDAYSKSTFAIVCNLRHGISAAKNHDKLRSDNCHKARRYAGKASDDLDRYAIAPLPDIIFMNKEPNKLGSKGNSSGEPPMTGFSVVAERAITRDGIDYDIIILSSSAGNYSARWACRACNDQGGFDIQASTAESAM